MRILSIPFLATLVACKSAPECKIQSSVDFFEPFCSGELIRFSQEARLVLSGAGGTLTAYLEPDPQAGIYGGDSGNSLTVTITGGENDILAIDRQTSLTVASVDDSTLEGRIMAVFEEGEVSGPFTVSVSDQ